MHKPVVILVRPQMGENIGAVARIMANFGFSELRIVAPRDGWPNPQATAMASGADHIIEGARIFPTVKEAIADLRYVTATSGRPRDMTKTCLGPVETTSEILKRGEGCGILFGPERTGLENDDLVYADAIVTIPTSPDFPSLNLAQSVAVMLYQWTISAPKEAKTGSKAPEQAKKEDVITFLGHLEQHLDKAGHFKSPDMKPKMMSNLKNIFIRSDLTDQEVRTLFGVLTSLTSPPSKKG